MQERTAAPLMLPPFSLSHGLVMPLYAALTATQEEQLLTYLV